MSNSHSTWPDEYLRPLVDDPKLLWKKECVLMWDEVKQKQFNLQALLFVTINDWPAVSNLSEQSNTGYKACTLLTENTAAWELCLTPVQVQGFPRVLQGRASWFDPATSKETRNNVS